MPGIPGFFFFNPLEFISAKCRTCRINQSSPICKVENLPEYLVSILHLIGNVVFACRQIGQRFAENLKPILRYAELEELKLIQLWPILKE
jgi:hypothetical protein